MRRIYLLLILLFFGVGAAVAQTRTVTGVVTDKGSGAPLPGVTVKVKNGTKGAETNAVGKYQVTIPASGAVTLTFSYIGYKAVDAAVAGEVLDMQMESSANVMDTIVVSIGYTAVKRKEVTGSSVSVTGDDLKMAPVTTAAQALTGKAAGVNVVTQSGAPGAPVNIVIRGGASITQSTTPLYIVDGFQMDDALRQIDINDIQTIDVLKDASATSIYGARGSNGVILITTRSGKKGKTQVNYNGYYGQERLGKKLPMLGVKDYVRYQYELQQLGGSIANWANYFGGSITDPNFYTNAYNYIDTAYGNKRGVDWQDQVFGGSTTSQNHNLSVGGGNEKTNFLFSYNNTGQKGIFAKHDYNRNGLRLKLEHEVAKNAKVNFNTDYMETRVNGGGSMGGALKLTLLQAPTGGIRYTNDQLVNSDIGNDMLKYDSQYDINNPIITNDAVTQTNYTRQFYLNTGLDLGITKDIKFRTLGSYLWQQEREDYFDDGRTRTALANLGPWGTRENSEKYTWQITNTVNWGHTYDKHKVNLLLGQEAYYSQTQNQFNSYYGFPVNNFGLNDVSLTKGNVKNEGTNGIDRTTLASFFTRASYNFDDRLIVNASLRADGSSKFGVNNKWGYFPSLSAAWRISEEAFMRSQNLVTDLKLRVGYGTAGNNAIDGGYYTTGYSGGSYAINKANFPTLTPGTRLGNPNIKWETIKSTNIGVDVEFLKRRFTFSMDLYNNESSDLLVEVGIPPSAGYKSQYQNIGAIRNRGIELVLGSNNISTPKFKWKTNVNVSFNRSKVMKLYGIGGQDQWITSAGGASFLIKVGQPIGQFYGYNYGGIYTTADFTQNADGTYLLKDGVARAASVKPANVKPGDVKYIPTAGAKDAAGNPTWNTDDRTVIGNAQPKFQGGMTNTFNYSGFDFTVFMNFAVGGKVFNANTQRFIGPYLPNQNTLTAMNSRFTLIDPATGKETTDLQRLAALNPQQNDPKAVWSLHGDNKIAISDPIDYYLEDASFLRLSTITLGYNLPKSVMSTIHLSKARVYCTLNNIHTFTKYKGYDPAVSANGNATTQGVDNSAYPVSKSVVFGVNISL
ncbi:TonB-linked outer membrane protein, SusC/RagA family [Filimonas lacunae]|uniref:TonB-linked outer membrane protein, SusC/RagA family n=1 Tax=Filimonas lacunae TaxID=477680 RepID=A0A173MCM6_9BACT|nr:TonB-dependent receptor [Filimonas lacunae]BAV05270.1 TonB-dependent receptor [Filimonas lacunae]SIT22289.1 TonB-linked outer membrane protein, SusC/RagA family [Filimonas lacunae]